MLSMSMIPDSTWLRNLASSDSFHLAVFSRRPTPLAILCVRSERQESMYESDSKSSGSESILPVAQCDSQTRKLLANSF